MLTLITFSAASLVALGKSTIPGTSKWVSFLTVGSVYLSISSETVGSLYLKVEKANICKVAWLPVSVGSPVVATRSLFHSQPLPRQLHLLHWQKPWVQLEMKLNCLVCPLVHELLRSFSLAIAHPVETSQAVW